MHPQPASDRRTAEAELHGLVAKFAPAHQRLVDATRRWLRKRLPTAHEIVYEYRDAFVISFSPNDQGYAGVFAIRGSATGLQFYFNQGKGLPDPEKLLQGKGTQVRWIPLEKVATLALPAVVRLVDEAIARNRLPFAPSGRGLVTIRSTTAKRKR